MKNIKFLFLTTIGFLLINSIFSQDEKEMNIEKTYEYLNNFIFNETVYAYYSNNPNYKENLVLSFCGWCDGVKNVKKDGTLSFTRKYQNPIILSFRLFDVNFSEIFENKGSYRLIIKSNSNNESINFLGTSQNSVVIQTKSYSALTRFRNAIIHLKFLIENDPQIEKPYDPFESSNINEDNIQLSVSKIEFKDSNNNKRIDQQENCTILIYLRNHNTSKISNIKLIIKEINNVSGLIFNPNIEVTSILGGQTISIELKVTGNKELQIGEANFEINLLKDNKELTKKNFKVATFNNGPENFIISKLPDIDIQIPKVNKTRNNCYAIVIGNEDYKTKQPNLSYESNVKYAINDAKIFKEYLINTIGIPNTNITYLVNATSAEMRQSLNKFKQIPIINPDAEIIFYYAGHGLPDEKTKEQYLIPVDVSSSNISFGLKINEIESGLSSNNPKQVLLILDACFSGAARNESLLSNRAVRVRPKENIIKGNSIIISASSNEEASKAYDEMQHGMFTYFLLKKIQETKGNVDLQTLFDFVYFNVREKSLLINNQFQTPTITKSPQIQNNLNEIKF